MGSEVENNTTLKEYFDKLFQYALSIGMTPHEFWEDDIDLFNHYHQAELIRQRKRNNEMWLQGLYVYNAVGSLAPVLNGLSKEHRAKAYLKRPIPLTEEERIEEQNRKVNNFKNYLLSISTIKGGKKNG